MWIDGTMNLSGTNSIESSTYELAVLRTELSNSSTLLAHAQGFVAFVISAIGLTKFLDPFWFYDLCSGGLLALGVAVLVRGIVTYKRTTSKIRREKGYVLHRTAQ